MTVVGVHVVFGVRAIMWADTERVYPSGASAGHTNKLVVNAAAGMALVSAGWAELGDAADAVACTAATFDEALGRLPAALRNEAARCVRRAFPADDPREYGDQIVLVAGHSAEFGCMVAFELAGHAFFAPVIVSQATYPGVPDIPPPDCLGDVVDVARRQARELRKSYPAIGCGRLTVALLERDHVTTAVPFDLTLDAWQASAAVAVGVG